MIKEPSGCPSSSYVTPWIQGQRRLQRIIESAGDPKTDQSDTVEGLARLDGLLDADTTDTDAAEGATPATPGSSPHDAAGCSSHARPHTAVREGAEQGPLCAEASRFGTEKRSKDNGAPIVGGAKDRARGGRRIFHPK